MNKRFATLFDGLKKNQAHAVALVYPVIYLLRRIMYTCLIIYMQPYAYASVHILIFTSLAMMAFALTESPWEDRLIGFQHFMNEVALYLILVLLALFSGVQLFDDAYTILGWALIGIFMMAVLMNTAVILSYSISHIKKVINGKHRVPWKPKKKQKRGKKGKIAPMPLSVSKTDQDDGFI